jgi:hypothetical protein
MPLGARASCINAIMPVRDIGASKLGALGNAREVEQQIDKFAPDIRTLTQAGAQRGNLEGLPLGRRVVK